MNWPWWSNSTKGSTNDVACPFNHLQIIHSKQVFGPLPEKTTTTKDRQYAVAFSVTVIICESVNNCHLAETFYHRCLPVH